MGDEEVQAESPRIQLGSELKVSSTVELVDDKPPEGRCTSHLRWWAKDLKLEANVVHLIVMLLLLGVTYIPIGAVLLDESNGLVEVKKRYDTSCSGEVGNGGSCSVSFTLPETLKAPVYVYYHLKGFPQNQRRYVESVSYNQLRGMDYEASECSPLQSNESGDTYYPCGMVAYTFFNDVIEMAYDGTNLTGAAYTGTDIAWDSDVRDKFVARPLEPRETDSVFRYIYDLDLPAVNDEDFIVWMRVAAFQDFRKLYRRIPSTTLEKGKTVTFFVEDNFFIENFDDVERSIILATVGTYGAKNAFLGIFYICVGVLFLFAAATIEVTRRYKGEDTQKEEVLPQK